MRQKEGNFLDENICNEVERITRKFLEGVKP